MIHCCLREKVVHTKQRYECEQLSKATMALQTRILHTKCFLTLTLPRLYVSDIPGRGPWSGQGLGVGSTPVT